MNVRALFLVLLVAAFVTVTGCAQVQAKFNQDVQAATIPDVTAARDAAVAANDTDGAACWGDVIAYLNSLPTSAANQPAPQIVGVASALEATRTANIGQPLPVPPIPPQLHRDCAVVVLDAQNLAAKLGLSAAALGKGLPVAKMLIAAPK